MFIQQDYPFKESSDIVHILNKKEDLLPRDAAFHLYYKLITNLCDNNNTIHGNTIGNLRYCYAEEKC